MSVGSLRLALISDGGLATSAKLLPRAADAVAARRGVELVAIVDAAYGHSRLRAPRAVLSRVGRWAFNRRSFPQIADRSPIFATAAGVARRHGVPLLRSGGPGVNDPAFVRSLEAVAPDATLVLMVGQIFKPPLLAACGTAVNYHDGLLPAYRGVGATGWSVYHEQPRSGFSFSLLAEGVDDGPVLLQDAVEIRPGETAGQVERAKTEAAGARIDEMLGLLLDGADGAEQSGEAATFTRANLAQMRSVGDPGTFEWRELQQRLRAFDEIHLRLAGETWPVTALERGERGGLTFTTADGVVATARRVRHFPPALQRLRSMRRR